MAGDPMYAKAYFVSSEGHDDGMPVSIRIELEGEGLPSLGLGDNQLHLMARPGLTITEMDQLAAQMRHFLKGVEIVVYRYPPTA